MKGSGANHYPRAPALKLYKVADIYNRDINLLQLPPDIVLVLMHIFRATTVSFIDGLPSYQPCFAWLELLMSHFDIIIVEFRQTHSHSVFHKEYVTWSLAL